MTKKQRINIIRPSSINYSPPVAPEVKTIPPIPTKRRKRKEYSKVLLNRITIMTITITLFALITMVWLQDLSSLPTLLALVFAEYAVGTAFYYNKAKAENKLKIMKKYKEAGILPEEIREQHLHDNGYDECDKRNYEDMS